MRELTIEDARWAVLGGGVFACGGALGECSLGESCGCSLRSFGFGRCVLIGRIIVSLSYS